MTVWRKRVLWITLICLVLWGALGAGCSAGDSAPDLETGTISSAAESWNGEFDLELPEGLSCTQDETGNAIFTDGTNTIGGKNVYAMPDGFEDSQYFSQEFLAALGIAEAQNETLGYSGGGSQNGIGPMGWGIEYFSDVPPGEPREVHSFHQFFIVGDSTAVVDVWFDLLVTDEQTKTEILNSISIPELGKTPETEHLDEPQLPAVLGNVYQVDALPEGYSLGMDEFFNLTFLFEEQTVGGVAVYVIPEGIYDPYDDHFIWLEKMAIPDFEDPSLCYTGGMTSGEGWLAEFASDVPEGEKRTVHHRHHFYVAGESLVDIWFDMLRLDYDTSETLLRAVQIPALAKPEVENTAESRAFEKCKAVMDAVQEETYYILTKRLEKSAEGRFTYFRTYCSHDGNKLSINSMLEEGSAPVLPGKYANRQAYLSYGDNFYSNAGNEEQDYIVWVESEPPEAYSGPWLEDFVWVKSHVTYIDTLTDDNGECIMYRVDHKYEDTEECSDSYFVNFNFDKDGNFLDVILQVNMFQENELTVTESIASLDPEEVAYQIECAYQQAIK